MKGIRFSGFFEHSSIVVIPSQALTSCGAQAGTGSIDLCEPMGRAATPMWH